MISLILKDRKRKNIIDELVAREDYRNIVVAGIDERITSGKSSRTYYVYLCEDPDMKNIYESEWIFDIEGSDIQTGDQVRLYESHAEKDIYWVDINHKES
jgi:6-phosphogluconolactonase/glucosamine-6-phosphate isomerase/deaminase